MENMKLLTLLEPRTPNGLRLIGDCKFCGGTLTDARDCENGSVYDDEGNAIDSSYCGNLECIHCHGCQGNPANDSWRAAAAITRCIKEGRPVTWLAQGGLIENFTQNWEEK